MINGFARTRTWKRTSHGAISKVQRDFTQPVLSHALLMTLLVCFVSGGATCARRQPTLTFPPPPPVFSGTPDLDAVVAAVNRTSVVRELSTNTATVNLISESAVPRLSATMAFRRDREFRLRASLPIVMGSGLDMGSNNDVFWFEVPEGMSRTLYYARHDQYQQQLHRAILPVDPTWVIDSLGLVQLDRAHIVKGPVVRPDGKLEILSKIPQPTGMFEYVCYIDPAAGHVTDQYLFSPAGQRIAESHASNHRFYPEQQCSLPHSVRLRLIPAAGEPLEMQIEIGNYAVNQILSGDPNLFVIPQGASNSVDLTTLGASPGMPVSAVVPPPTYQSAELGPMPYRGIVR